MSVFAVNLIFASEGGWYCTQTVIRLDASFSTVAWFLSLQFAMLSLCQPQGDSNISAWDACAQFLAGLAVVLLAALGLTLSWARACAHQQSGAPRCSQLQCAAFEYD